ncbi:MAG TPA: phenylalanine--tRNA ligase subunit alpha, partial [Phenylobacterium sp.]|nr:phenylalanine--tRNA ligase subunit alpha [Phenylobacterium sp.]
MTDLDILKTELIAQVDAAADPAALEAIRVAALGKSGQISELLKSLGKMSPEDRREKGPAINGLRDAVAERIAQRKAAMEAAELDRRLAAETIDLSL